MNKTFRRGQVWFKVEAPDTSTRVQSGSRPVLIFSSDSGNTTSDVVSVIPLTSETKPDIDINVVFHGNGKRQTALCNMLGPCDKSKLTRYLFSVSDSVMENIEHGVLIANQMKRYISKEDSDMYQLFNQFKSLIDGMVLQKFNEIISNSVGKQKQQDIRISELSNEIEKLKQRLSCTQTQNKNNKGYKSLDSSRNSEAIGSDTMRNALAKALSVPIADDDSVEDKSHIDKVKKPKSNRRVWTLEKCKQYVEDKLKLPASEIVEKYNLDTTMQVSQYYSYCRTKLNKAGIDYEGK